MHEQYDGHRDMGREHAEQKNASHIILNPLSHITAQQSNALAASSFRWTTAFSILHPVQFLCLIVPMLLRSLTNHATRHSEAQAPDVSGARRKWASERAMVTLLRLRQ